jgi:hypothetical protein
VRERKKEREREKAYSSSLTHTEPEIERMPELTHHHMEPIVTSSHLIKS